MHRRKLVCSARSSSCYDAGHPWHFHHILFFRCVITEYYIRFYDCLSRSRSLPSVSLRIVLNLLHITNGQVEFRLWLIAIFSYSLRRHTISYSGDTHRTYAMASEITNNQIISCYNRMLHSGVCVWVCESHYFGKHSFSFVTSLSTFSAHTWCLRAQTYSRAQFMSL